MAFQRRLAREDISLTHTIIQPTIDKRTDARIVGNKVTIHKVGETADGIVVRGARMLATLAPFADEMSVYPGRHPPRPTLRPGLRHPARHARAEIPVPRLRRRPGRRPVRPAASSRFDEQDAFGIFDDVVVPRDRVFIDGDVEIYNRIAQTGSAIT